MLLFSLVDLPRSTWGLPNRTTGRSGRRGLRPTLLARHDGQTQERIARVISLFEEAVGHPRSELDERLRTLEETMGNYRVARCLARCIDSWYGTTAPDLPLKMPPAQIRRTVFQAAQEHHGGVVAAADRTGFLADVAAQLDCTPGDLETAMFGDTPDRVLLTRDGAPPTAAEVISRYNAAAVATLLAAAAPLTMRVSINDSMAIKALYRAAKALHVGVDLTVSSRNDDVDDPSEAAVAQRIEATLYGPGSRALVRLRNPLPATGDDLSEAIPAAGGPSVVAVVRSLIRYSSAQGELSGWGRVLLPDQRQYIVPFDSRLLRMLIEETAEESNGASEAVQYDSAVEEKLGAGFMALSQRGMSRGWQITREPRAVFVETPDTGTQVFLPDFSFRRGAVDVLCEVIGFYTEEYLARKARKMALLAGRVRLLLLAEERLAPRFATCGHPVLTYKEGRAIALPALLDTLDARFDPPQQRRATARAALAALISRPGPAVPEETLLATIGAVDRGELLALWTDLSSQVPLSPMQYLPGYGLLAQSEIDNARVLLSTHVPIALDQAIDLLRSAGLSEADETFLVALGYRVIHEGLFGEATVHAPDNGA